VQRLELTVCILEQILNAYLPNLAASFDEHFTLHQRCMHSTELRARSACYFAPFIGIEVPPIFQFGPDFLDRNLNGT